MIIFFLPCILLECLENVSTLSYFHFYTPASEVDIILLYSHIQTYCLIVYIIRLKSVYIEDITAISKDYKNFSRAGWIAFSTRKDSCIKIITLFVLHTPDAQLGNIYINVMFCYSAFLLLWLLLLVCLRRWFYSSDNSRTSMTTVVDELLYSFSTVFQTVWQNRLPHLYTEATMMSSDLVWRSPYNHFIHSSPTPNYTPVKK